MHIDFIKDKEYSKLQPSFNEKKRVFNMMRTHLYGITPVNIFKQRHPNESKDKYAHEYRVNNYRAITLAWFQQAVCDVQEVLTNIKPTINWNTQTNNKQKIESIKFVSSNRRLNLWQWFAMDLSLNYLADANSYLVVLPNHPTSRFIPSYEYELPNFDAIKEQKIDIEVKYINCTDIRNVDNERIEFYAGEYEYKKGLKAPYYYIITKDSTSIEIPNSDGKATIMPLYANNLQYVPFVALGNIEVEDENANKYYISELFGASQYADLLIGQYSDLQISLKRFTYPRHYMHAPKCPNTNCEYDDKLKCYADSGSTCNTCHGSGYVQEMSNLGARVIEVKSGFEETGELRIPEAFVSPPTDGTRLSYEYCEYVERKVVSSLCIATQNVTNQSAESKGYDMRHKVSRNARIVTHLLTIYEIAINIIDEYLGGNGNNSVVIPESFDIYEANDIAGMIVEAKNSKLPDVALIELTKMYLLKKYGANIINKKIIDYLAIYDRFFVFANEEKLTAKAIYGESLTTIDYLLNDKAWAILQGYAEREPAMFVKMTMDEINTFVRNEINKIYPAPLLAPEILPIQ